MSHRQPSSQQLDPIITELMLLRGKLRVMHDDWRRADLGGGIEITPEEWKEVFKDVSPMQLYRRIENAAGPHDDVKVDISIPHGHERARLAILHNSTFEAPARNGMDFVLRQDGSARLMAAEFKRSETGKSIAKGYLRETAAILKDIGVSKITLFTQHLGGYAWAKYGFEPETEKHWDQLKDAVGARMHNTGGYIIFENRAHAISSGEKTIIDTLLTSGNPHDLPHLATLNRVIGNYRGKELTVGKALLVDAYWEGALPLQDGNSQYERFLAYTEHGVNRARQSAGIA